MKTRCGMVLLGVLLCGGVLAGDESHRKAAEELLAVSGVEKSYLQMAEQLAQDLVRQKPHLAEFQGVLREFIEKNLAWADVKADLADCYVQTFSEVEIRKLIEFYSSPTGQKALAVMPELALKGRSIAEKRLMGKSEELNRTLFLAAMKKQPVKSASTNEAAGKKR